MGTKYRVIALQIKEKFGGLRFYYHVEIDGNPPWYESFHNWMIRKIQGAFFKRRLGRLYWKLNGFRKIFYSTRLEKIDDAISKAEADSFEICEHCGQPGSRRGEGWVVTLCDKCDAKQIDNQTMEK
jgi:hypothetical protein